MAFEGQTMLAWSRSSGALSHRRAVLELADVVAIIDERLTDVVRRPDLDRFATKADMDAQHEETRRHFRVIAESLRDDIKLVAEAAALNSTKIEDLRCEVNARFDGVDRRLDRLQARGAG